MNSPTTTTPNGTGTNALARQLQIVLGIWLFISAFIWPHTTAQRTNTWICGLIAIAFAIIAMKEPRARWVNTALAVWLFFSTIALPHISVGTEWNNVLVAIAMFILSLAPSTWQARTMRHA